MKNILPVSVGSIDLENDCVEFYLCIGSRRVTDTSIFAFVKPGESRADAAALAFTKMIEKQMKVVNA